MCNTKFDTFFLREKIVCILALTIAFFHLLCGTMLPGLRGLCVNKRKIVFILLFHFGIGYCRLFTKILVWLRITSSACGTFKKNDK